VIPETLAEAVPGVNPQPKLTWIKSKARLIDPSPLGKRRSRELKDDIYLAAALGAGAEAVVSYDEDLLALEKPFGIATLRSVGPVAPQDGQVARASPSNF